MSARARTAVGSLTALFATVFCAYAFARFSTVHHHTYDLAFYARMAWGLAHGDAWVPIVGGNFLGLHFSVPMVVLGLLGRLWDTVSVLIVVQSAAVAVAAWPFARIGVRRFGPVGALLGACAWLLYPNLGHVATYEFHPGTLAVLPLAWALERLDAEDPKWLFWFSVATVAFRADLAMITALLGCVAYLRGGTLHRAGLRLVVFSVAYFAFYVFVLHALFAPTHGSMHLHFAPWGDSPLEILATLVSEPGRVWAHLSEPRRLLYVPKLLAPLALLPLLRPLWLLPALPVVGINLLSVFPTTTDMDCHYQTAAVPFLCVAALDGLAALHRGPPRRLAVAALAASLLLSSALASGLPWARDHAAADFRADARTRSAERILAAIPEQADVAVQAPDPLLPHLAERTEVNRAPPPERLADYVVLDVSHRLRYAHRGDLLRTSEEPLARSWLARSGYGVVLAEPYWVLLERGKPPREGVLERYTAPPGRSAGLLPLTSCLSAADAELRGDTVRLRLRAHGVCPADLALRLGARPDPQRVDLLFDGVLSPAHLRDGDWLYSEHTLDPQQQDAIAELGLHVGVLRSSGCRPEGYDPISVQVPLRRQARTARAETLHSSPHRAR